MKVRIQGKIHGQNERTGKWHSRQVSFIADSTDAWIDIVDRGIEIAHKANPNIDWMDDDLQEVTN